MLRLMFLTTSMTPVGRRHANKNRGRTLGPAPVNVPALQ